MQLYVADVAHAREVHHHALEAEAEACVAAGAVAAQVAVPPVVGGIHAKLLDAALEHVETLLALAAADDLADAGHKAVRRGDGFAVVVQAHIERLDLLGIIGDEHGALEDLLGEETLVLGLEISAPVDLVVELVVVLLEQLHRVGVGDAAEVAAGDMLQTLDESLIDEAVEEREVVGAALHDGGNDVFYHRLHDLKVAVEVAERHLRLDHPELGGVARGVGILGAEGGTEGVDVAESHGEVLGVELAGDGQAGLLAEEVLRIIDLAILGLGDVLEVERRDLEHLARALAVGAGDDGGVDVGEAAALKELMHREGRGGAHAEGRVEKVRARAEMLDGAQELDAVALLLQGIVRRGRALDRDLGRLELKRLLGLGREHDLADDDERRADVLGGDLLIVGENVRVHDDLQVAEAGAVVELDEAEGLEVADGLGPAADGHGHAAVALGVSVDRCDFRNVYHVDHLLSVKFLKFSEKCAVKAAGHQLAERHPLCLACAVEADDLHIGGKLIKELAARAAGVAEILAVADDDDAAELGMPLADRLDGGSALSAEREAVAGIFNVAAGIDRTVLALERRADREMGIGDIRAVEHFDRLLHQLMFAHSFLLTSPRRGRDGPKDR
mgnify:CR=1 FL=1